MGGSPTHSSSYALEVDLAVVLDDLAVFLYLRHDGLRIGAVLKLDGHLKQHEIDAGVPYARGLLRGEFHLVRAVGAVDFDLVGLLHGWFLPFGVGFEYMKRALEKGDILVISSLDRLGRNAKELKEQWEYFKDNKISVQVLDMPSLNLDYTDEKMQPITQLINNIIFEIFSWKAESDRVQIVERTKQGLEQAKNRGKTLGRPKVEITEEFIEVWKKWKNGEFKTTVEAMKESKTSKTTFYRLNKILEMEIKNNDK